MTRLAPSLLLLAIAGCGTFDEDRRWFDSLRPDSPCFRVDLTDGLDEASSAEVEDLIACIDYHGHIAPLRPVVEGLAAESRAGVPASIELARAVNSMWTVDVDPFILAGVLGGALRAGDAPIHEATDLFLEWTYGQRAHRVRAGAIPLTEAEHLQQGVLVPLAPVLRQVATAILDDPQQTAAWVGSWLPSDDTRRWVRTLESWTQSAHPTVSVPVQGLILHLGELLAATDSPENDEWAEATGHSLRDLIEVYLLAPHPALKRIESDLQILATDPGLRASLEPSLVSLHTDGHLAGVAPQVVWMSQVTATGAPRSPGQISAMESFVRLLASSNQPMSCEVDLWLTSIQAYSTPNLAVLVLSTLADQELGRVLDGLDVVSWLTQNTVTDWILRQAVNSGLCSGLSPQQLDDLAAVATMTRPEAYDLLAVFVHILHTMKHEGSTSHPDGRLPVLADLVSRLYMHPGAYPALEELIRDIGEEQVLVDLVNLVPVLAHPAAYGLRAGDEPAASLPEALDLVQWLLTVDPANDQTGWARLLPLLRPALEHDATWVALSHAGALMRDDRTQTARALALLPPLLSADPELQLLDQLARVLSHEPLTQPVLRLIEAPQVTDRLLASEPQGEEEEVPLAFAARLVVDGTLASLMDLIDRLFGAGPPAR